MADTISFSDFQKLDPPRLAESRREADIRKGIITFSEFSRLDIRIGTVVEASVPEWSHWVMKLVVDLGPKIGKRTVFAGIMNFYKPKELVGKQFPFVVNLEPKKMGPMESNGTQNYSEGMMIMAVEEPQQYASHSRGLRPRARPQATGALATVGQVVVSQLRGSGVPARHNFADVGGGSSEKGEEVPVLFKLWKKVPNGTKVR